MSDGFYFQVYDKYLKPQVSCCNHILWTLVFSRSPEGHAHLCLGFREAEIQIRVPWEALSILLKVSALHLYKTSLVWMQ